MTLTERMRSTTAIVLFSAVLALPTTALATADGGSSGSSSSSSSDSGGGSKGSSSKSDGAGKGGAGKSDGGGGHGGGGNKGGGSKSDGGGMGGGNGGGHAGGGNGGGNGGGGMAGNGGGGMADNGGGGMAGNGGGNGGGGMAGNGGGGNGGGMASNGGGGNGGGMASNGGGGMAGNGGGGNGGGNGGGGMAGNGGGGNGGGGNGGGGMAGNGGGNGGGMADNGGGGMAGNGGGGGMASNGGGRNGGASETGDRSRTMNRGLPGNKSAMTQNTGLNAGAEATLGGQPDATSTGNQRSETGDSGGLVRVLTGSANQLDDNRDVDDLVEGRLVTPDPNVPDIVAIGRPDCEAHDDRRSAVREDCDLRAPSDAARTPRDVRLEGASREAAVHSDADTTRGRVSASAAEGTADCEAHNHRVEGVRREDCDRKRVQADRPRETVRVGNVVATIADSDPTDGVIETADPNVPDIVEVGRPDEPAASAQHRVGEEPQREAVGRSQPIQQPAERAPRRVVDTRRLEQCEMILRAPNGYSQDTLRRCHRLVR